MWVYYIFHHSINCEMVMDMLDAARKIEKRLQKDESVKHLKPVFQLAGSIMEGTRFGYASELDMGLKFLALIDDAPFKVHGDPFSLKKADGTASQNLMETYFDESKRFLWHKFKLCLLEATDRAIVGMFDDGENPPNLHRIVTNQQWLDGDTRCGGKCKRDLKKNSYEHCERCPVVVVQTKIGLTLQFLWKWPGDADSGRKEIYTSIDIIPELPIISRDAIGVARTFNEGVLDPAIHPQGWYKSTSNYETHYKVSLTQMGSISHVVLKEMNFFEGYNHHVRPAQADNPDKEKFSSDRMRKIYGYLKCSKKNIDGMDLSSFWAKQELLNPQFGAILDSCKEADGEENDDRAVVSILTQPEFRSKIRESRIDLEKSSEYGEIWFKK